MGAIIEILEPLAVPYRLGFRWSTLGYRVARFLTLAKAV